MKKPTALVTGGAGFIGRHLCAALLQDYQVVCMDDYSRGTLDKTPGVGYIEGHTCDFFDIMDNKGWHMPDVIVHLAEGSRVTPSFDDIEGYHKSNMIGTFNVLQYCVKHNIKLVYAGSSSIFAPNGKHDSPYAFFKNTNAELVECYGKWFDLRYAITFFYNVYGPSMKTTEYDSVISIFEQQYRDGKPLTVVSPGTQRRSYIHVSDVVSGLIAACHAEGNGTYHFGTSTQYDLLDIVDMFSTDHVMVPARKGDRHDGADADTASAIKLGWEPKIDLKDWICEMTK